MSTRKWPLYVLLFGTVLWISSLTSSKAASDQIDAMLRHAMSVHRSRDLVGAERLYRQLLNQSGAGAILITAHLCLGDLYLQQSKIQEAEQQYRQAQQAAERRYGDSDPFLVPILNRFIHLGKTSRQWKYLEQAAPKAIAIKSRFMPSDCHELSADYEAWHIALRNTGRLAEDEPVVRKLYETRKHTADFARNQNTSALLREFAVACRLAGKKAESIQRSREAIAAAERRSGDVSMHTDTERALVAVNLYLCGQKSEAESLFHRVIGDCKSNVMSARDRADVLITAAFECQSNHLDAQAQDFLMESLNLYRQNPDLDPAVLITWLERCIPYYQSRPLPAKIAYCLSQARKLSKKR